MFSFHFLREGMEMNKKDELGKLPDTTRDQTVKGRANQDKTEKAHSDNKWWAWIPLIPELVAIVIGFFFESDE